MNLILVNWKLLRVELRNAVNEEVIRKDVYDEMVKNYWTLENYWSWS